MVINLIDTVVQFFVEFMANDANYVSDDPDDLMHLYSTDLTQAVAQKLKGSPSKGCSCCLNSYYLLESRSRQPLCLSKIQNELMNLLPNISI